MSTSPIGQSSLLTFAPARRTRAFDRAPLSGKVDLWLRRQKAPMKARDISAGGLFLEADPNLDLGSYASVRVRVPGEGAFTALCRVTRRVLPHGLKPGGLGLEFLNLGPKERQWVTTYVARSASLPRPSVH